MPATVQGAHLGPGNHASRPAANAAGQPFGALYSCTDHALIYKTDGSTWATYATLGTAGGGVTATNAPCTADTTIPNTSTYTDVTGCTASLAAGTYIALVSVQWLTSSGGNVIVCKILANATDVAVVEMRSETTSGNTHNEFHVPPFVLGSTQTVKLQAAAAVQATIKRRAPDFNGNNIDSTVVTFLKIA